MHPSPTILYVITKASWGGAQRYVYDLACAAQGRGYGVTVAYGEGGLLVKKLADAGVRTVRIPGLQRDVSAFGELAALGGFIRLFKNEHPDIVHLNSSKAGFTGALAARLAGVPQIIFTAHGWAFNEARPISQRGIFRMFHTFTVMLTTETICVSEAVKRDIDSALTHKKLRLIRNGITCPILLGQTEAREKLLPGKAAAVWIGMLAELHKTKRVDLAIEAFSRINAAHPETILVVFGEGQERKNLEALIERRGLAGRVFLPGFIEDGVSYLSAFDMLLLPSRTEALAYAALEAGCASLPVIASNVGGLPEILENDAGILFPSGNTDALATAMTGLLENPQKAKTLGENLHNRVTAQFSQERMIAETFALYR